MGVYGAVSGDGAIGVGRSDPDSDAHRGTAHHEISGEIHYRDWLADADGRLYYAAMHLNLLISMESAVKLRVIQAFGIGFLFVPITMVGYIGIAAGEKQQRFGAGEFHAQYRQQRGDVAGYDGALAQVAGASVGLAAHTTSFDPAFQSQVNGLANQLTHAGSAAPDARLEAYGRIYRSMEAQATTLAYVDTFLMLAIASAVMLALTFIVRRNDPGGALRLWRIRRICGQSADD